MPALAALPAGDLTDLSLEELMSIEVTVTSAARHPQRLGDTAAAIFVLSGEEIRRSGATSLPDALRLVPGVQVTRLGSNRWRVTARGFNGRNANKMLLLIDGVSAYTPLFSGVLWERENVFLPDVDRIEVIRGPGASLWGANAVNGVINVITKPAAETTGGLVSLRAGTEERGAASVRYGTALGDAGHMRVYGEGIARDAGARADGSSADDASRYGRSGFRADLATGQRDKVTLQGDLYRGSGDAAATSYSLTPPYTRLSEGTILANSAKLLGRWTRSLGPSSQVMAQSYYTYNTLQGFSGNFREETADFELEHRLSLGEGSDFVWGGGARWYRSRVTGGNRVVADPQTDTTHLVSLFVQNEQQLVPDRLKLTLGTKLEHTDYTGFEVQPTARLVWTPHPDHSVWAAVSRAVRAPSRSERDFTSLQRVVAAPGRPPVAVTVNGDDDLQSEDVLAYELGYRVRPDPALSIDIATFYNVYRELRGLKAGTPVRHLTPVPYTELPLYATNSQSGRTWGAELAAEWDVMPGWRLKGSYSLLRKDLTGSPTGTAGDGATMDDGDPEHQVVLRSSHDLPYDLTLDLTVRAVDRLAESGVAGYVDADLRLGWKPGNGWEFALVGQNLVHADRPEAAANLLEPAPSRVQRGVYVELTRRF